VRAPQPSRRASACPASSLGPSRVDSALAATQEAAARRELPLVPLPQLIAQARFEPGQHLALEAAQIVNQPRIDDHLALVG
jgi:hypothetical protein